MKDFLEAIKAGLALVDKNDLFSNPDYSILEESCISFLRERGYKVVEPVQYSAKEIRRIDDLYVMFYNLLRRQHPDWSIYMHEARDRMIASRLVEEVKKTNNFSDKEALRHAAEMVLAVIYNEDRFRFKQTYDFSIFGQDHLRWVSILANQIVNDSRRKEADIIFAKYEKLFLESVKDQPKGFNDIDKLLEALEDGKEKGRKTKRRKSRFKH